MTRTLYDIVGVSRDATTEEIETAFRRRAQRLHPDAGGGTAEFAELSSARDTLIDPARRRRYDEAAGETMHDTDADALQLVAGFMLAVINACEPQGIDPSRIDLVDNARTNMRNALQVLVRTRADQERRAAQLRRAAGRVRGARPRSRAPVVRRMLENEADRCAQAAHHSAAGIDAHERALRILDEISFDMETDVSVLVGNLLLGGTTGGGVT